MTIPGPSVPDAPTLDTPRLVLSGHGLSDFADCAAMWGDADVVRFLGHGQPLGAEDVWSRLLRYAGHWPLMGYGYWAVRERATGRFVGDVGFAHLKRDMQPGLGDAPEIGWVLASWAQGRGFATEAVMAALQWGDAALPAARTVCIIRPDHDRSIRLAEAVGYRRLGPSLYKTMPMLIFERQGPSLSGAATPRLDGSTRLRNTIGIPRGVPPRG